MSRTSAPYVSHAVLGAMAGLAMSLMTVSFAALIFTGPLNAFLPFAMTIMLLGGAVAALLTAAWSRIPTMLAIIQSAPAALAGTITASLVASGVFANDPTGLLSTTIAIVFISTLGIAVLVWLFAQFRLSQLVQFLPYPVTCGFLAGVGWLMLNASIRVVTDLPIALHTLDDLFLGEALWHLAPMIAAGVVLYVLSRRFPGPLTLPALFALCIAGFYTVAVTTGQDLSRLRAAGWVFGPFSVGGFSEAFEHLSLHAVHWGVIVEHTGLILVIVVVSLVTALIFLTGIEVALRQEIDIDHELKVIGLCCLCNAGIGTVAAYPSAPLTILFTKQGAASRFLGFSAATVLLMVGMFGPAAMNYMPKTAFAAILFLLALGLLIEWLWNIYRRLSRAEYVIVVMIFLTVVAFGFLEAVALGVLVCAVFFVMKYSTLSLIKTESDGTTYRSDVDRSPTASKLLNTEGARLLFFRLEGYLFFGTASLLLNRIRAKVVRRQNRSAYIVLDFRGVSGIDSSAIFAFVKLRQLAERDDLVLVLTELRQELLAYFRMGDIVQGEDDPQVRVFGESDVGVEWVEERLLEEAGMRVAAQPIAETLIALTDGDERARALVQHLERMELAKGDYLYRLGDAGRDIYFIERGTIALMVPLDSGGELRLRKLGAGTVAGELDFYDGTPRDAHALATEACLLWRFSASRLEQLSHEAPTVAAMFHEMMARVMSRRVMQLTDELRSVLA